jgi:hypothetical protein
MSRDVEVIRNFVEHFPPFQLLPIWALLRLEKATDPTVSFSRIINCARLTATPANWAAPSGEAPSVLVGP